MEDLEGGAAAAAGVESHMNILVTGVEGYIGSVLAPYLMDRGHSVTGLDTGFYREGWLYHPQHPRSPSLY